MRTNIPLTEERREFWITVRHFLDSIRENDVTGDCDVDRRTIQDALDYEVEPADLVDDYSWLEKATK